MCYQKSPVIHTLLWYMFFVVVLFDIVLIMDITWQSPIFPNWYYLEEVLIDDNIVSKITSLYSLYPKRTYVWPDPKITPIISIYVTLDSTEPTTWSLGAPFNCPWLSFYLQMEVGQKDSLKILYCRNSYLIHNIRGLVCPFVD